jgi:hypothetical protein
MTARVSQQDDLVGQRFGQLTVIEPNGFRSRCCVCACGREVFAQQAALARKQRSCGGCSQWSAPPSTGTTALESPLHANAIHVEAPRLGGRCILCGAPPVKTVVGTSGLRTPVCSRCASAGPRRDRSSTDQMIKSLRTA